MTWLNNLIIRISKSWQWTLGLFLLTGACLAGLTNLGGESFEAKSGGHQAFDLQNNLTSTQVYEQLATWTDAAKQAYYAFAAVDFVFPLVAGLFLAGVIAFALRHGIPAAYDWLVARRLLPVLMLGTLFDWFENLFALTAVSSYPAEMPAVAGGLVLAKQLKLACVFGFQGLAVLLLVAAALRVVVVKLRG